MSQQMKCSTSYTKFLNLKVSDNGSLVEAKIDGVLASEVKALL